MSVAQMVLMPDTPDRPAESLQELVVERLRVLGGVTGPMSLRQAAERSRGLVSYEVIRQIARGVYGRQITARVAGGLSLALGVPEEQIYRLADIGDYHGPWTPPKEIELCDASDREMFAELIRKVARGKRHDA